MIFRHSSLQTGLSCFLEPVWDRQRCALKSSMLWHRAQPGTFCQPWAVLAGSVQSAGIRGAWECAGNWNVWTWDRGDCWGTVLLCSWCLVALCTSVGLTGFRVVPLRPCAALKFMSSPGVIQTDFCATSQKLGWVSAEAKQTWNLKGVDVSALASWLMCYIHIT